ncbi:type VI secretion system ImpA-related domain protein [Syntrophotalea carbinolica DSM 2380]|uniref:Type VI secretion system ImpA-related domain protein n=1 Tax=Syntrophotalea carbinolica (strain DSM 2380 / NBRC 103641 / GraBd1) TaxID=338963 RepID=Q3A0Q9_SYNC1|nr:type VI secretion system protein TssA [Syntrophotalea carbinolica]ABA90048.1 type VI secretion system ImpA-related domain protein [Syntrophotalea carbinolica DSM 2380]
MTPLPPKPNPEWLLDIARPLQDKVCGDDPRYLDAFQRIKEESDKLRDVDYAMIMATCRELLAKEAKDLRIAGYYLVAAAYIEGLPGLLDGLKMYRVLLQNFWCDCHPQSASGRRAALNLLANPRLVAFAERSETPVSLEILVNLHQEIDGIHLFLTEKLGEETPRLSRLAPWVEERLRRLKPTTPKGDPPSQATAQQPAPSDTTESTQELNSEHGVEFLTRQIHKYLLNSGDFLRALAYSRALRWGKLALPPHDQGRTRIPAPRASGLTQLENTLTCDSLDQALTCSENLFFEPGFQLLFDLQFHLFQYLEANHQPDLACFVRNALRAPLDRHPELLNLQFDDGRPFAGTECLLWIQQWQTSGVNSPSRGPLNEGPDEISVKTLVDDAMQLAKRKKLPEALQNIQSLPCQTEKQRIQKRLAEARLCLTAGKADMAEVVLADMQQYILAHHLPLWDPALAVAVLQQRLTVLQALEKASPGERKQHLTQQRHELRQLLCKIDVISAAAFI